MANAKKFYLTASGRAQFEGELLSLENYMRSVASKLKRTLAREKPEENGDFEIAQNELYFAERRIEEVTHILQNSKTIVRPRHSSAIKLGSKIEVEQVGGGQRTQRQQFDLVGPLESSPDIGRISHESPLGQALIGRHIGETVVLDTAGGETNYQILKIN